MNDGIKNPEVVGPDLSQNRSTSFPGPLPSSLEEGCGWSRAHADQRTKYEGWVLNLILLSVHLNSISGRDKSPVHFPASIVKNFTHKPLPPFVFLTVSKVTNGNRGIRERSLRTKLKNDMLVISTCVVALAKIIGKDLLMYTNWRIKSFIMKCIPMFLYTWNGILLSNRMERDPGND